MNTKLFVWGTRQLLLFLIGMNSHFEICASDSLHYSLQYLKGESEIQITLEFAPTEASAVKLIIPRSGPGTYDLINYIAYVDQVVGITSTGKTVKGNIGEGSYFEFSTTDTLRTIEYRVEISRMEKEMLSASGSSKIRSDYLGLLGYSCFGFPEGMEGLPLSLRIKVPSGWPVFSTLDPESFPVYGKGNFSAASFAELADGQYLMGPGLHVERIEGAPIPFFVAVYGETGFNISEIGRRGLLALNGLKNYFGFIPMPHYSMCFEFMVPLSDRHDYGFSMEHLNSMTASFDTSAAIQDFDPEARIGSIVHHIGHSWIPLRSYGSGYRPFEWQTAPVIETIWFNEGFIWYVSFYKVLHFENILDRFRSIMDSAPEYIQQKSLRELSILGSTQYALDFRIGMNLFSRGALLAHELDLHITEKTGGLKSLKDVLVALMDWTAVNQRAFAYEELLALMEKAVNLDLSEVWNKWQKPQNN